MAFMNSYNIKTKLKQVPQLSEAEIKDLEKVVDKYPFKANDYYLSLINWSDPNDPIKRLIIPDKVEIEDTWKGLDPSGEKDFTVMPGVEHKYDSVCLLLVSNVCAGICRYCFRKRLFKAQRKDYLLNFQKAFEYIKSHPEINNVLITGGDPFILKTDKIIELLKNLRDIEHVKIIRFGTRMPQFFPMRISNDPALLSALKEYSLPDKRIYIITHYVHKNEITKESVNCINSLIKSNLILANQTPFIRGINDSPKVLSELLNTLSFIGVPPYYIFQCRPAAGNKSFSVPIEEAYLKIEKAKKYSSGLAKRAKYVMSHLTGKIEILGLTEENIIFKYHRAADNRNSGKILIFKRNPKALWLDDYTDLIEESFL
jgi:lysine 2,3-aminomutase